MELFVVLNESMTLPRIEGSITQTIEGPYSASRTTMKGYPKRNYGKYLSTCMWLPEQKRPAVTECTIVCVSLMYSITGAQTPDPRTYIQYQ
jgi:hypothetical protein